MGRGGEEKQKVLEWVIRKKIERAFYEYGQNKKLGAEYVDNLAYEGTVANLSRVGSSSGKVGNPTEAKGIRVLLGDKDYLWCRVVENTMKHFEGTGKDTLIKLKYFEKLTEWRLCDKLYISRSSLFEWIEDLTTYGAMLAIQDKLIKI